MSTAASLKSSPAPLTTEEKLIAAAREVLSREGLGRATTREIARVAEVNEVTLFRKFKTRQGLLEAALQQAFASNALDGFPSVQDGATLRELVEYFAQRDFELKRANTSLMRVLVGESHRLGEQESEILKRIFVPWKKELAGQFREAQKLGLMRQDLEPVMVVDQLVAMLFVGALRTEGKKLTEYSADAYLSGCVEMILTCITPPAGAAAKKKA